MNKLKVKIIGAGPTGSLLAISLASLDIYVDLYDTVPIEVISKNDRSYAITHSSRRFFQKINIWQDISEVLSPFKSLLVYDDNLKNTAVFKVNDLSKDNYEYHSIGWVIQHNALMQILSKKILSSKYISLLQISSSIIDNSDYTFSIASDGKFSSSRQILNIPFSSFKYDQGCITFKALLRGIKDLRAYEILRKEGPLAILPIKKDLYQIFWSAPINTCKKRMNLSRASFLDNLCAVLPSGIEPDCLVGSPCLAQIYFLIAFKLYKDNKILLGEAAHCIHPVGGQGLNLSIRDINQLYILFDKLIKSKIKEDYLAFIYQRSRFLDNIITALLTDSIVRIFSNNNPMILFIRKIFFDIILKTRFYRKLIFSIMTDGYSHLFSIFKPN